LGEAYRRFETLKERGRHSEAVPYAEAVLALTIEAYGEDTSWTAARLNDLAELHRAQRHDAKAEPLFRRALTIFETGDLDAAEPLFRRALKIFTQTLGPDDPDVAISLYNLARIYETRGVEAVAESFYRRAIAIWEKAQGPEDLELVPWLRDYARLLRRTDRIDLARSMEARAAAIEGKSR
jgi:tetratricopeptide (TPR) repeat protein